MNAVVPQNFGQVSTRFAGQAVENDLGAGVQQGFGIIGYRGKTWSIRFRGEERTLMREDGDGPRNSIEVVILKSATALSKIFYAKGYQEGSTEPPDCFSTNGVTPDPSAQNKQNPVCASCPKNAWGSRITDAGKKGKACSDSKRLAIVPLQDLENEMFGGPMLLRVPAASLGDLANYGGAMSKLGYPYFAIGTRISFNVQEAYPKFEFKGIRPLTDAEADIVLGLRDDPRVQRILADGAELHNQHPQITHQAQLNAAFEQPPATATTTSTGNQSWTGASQPNHSTSQVSSTPAQPAGQKPTQEPGHTTQSHPQSSMGGKPSGFGAMSSGGGACIASSTQTATPPATTQPELDFEATLDAQLAELLPP